MTWHSTAWYSIDAAECRSKIKTRLETAYGEWVERIPAWITWATQVCQYQHHILHVCSLFVCCICSVHDHSMKAFKVMLI